MPPLGGCVRVLLAELISDPTERHAAFALETLGARDRLPDRGRWRSSEASRRASAELALAVCAGLAE